MADKKISQLTELASANAVTDFLPVVDTSVGETKKIALANLPMSDAAIEQSYPYTTDFQSGTEQTRNLTSITSSDGYYFNSNLTSVYVGSNVTSIGSAAFGYCSGLTSATIGNSVTSLGSSAFSGSSSLATINCLATTAPTLGSNVFNNVAASDIHVPVGATGYGTTYGGLTVVFDL